MAELKKEKEKIFLELNEREAKELEVKGKFFELNKIKDNIIVLIETKKEINLFDSKQKKEDEKIFSLLSQRGKKSLKMKVEGQFEKYLSEKELKRFNELLKEGIIEKFKLNEKYKKAIYRIAQKKEKKFDFNSSTKTIEARGFQVLTPEQAKDFSAKFEKEIKEEKIKGIKGFDGYFYVIYSDLLEEMKPKILVQLKHGRISLNELKEKSMLPIELIKAVTEFLKEEGEIIEKRKGIYELIE
jgi:hypothetical protein